MSQLRGCLLLRNRKRQHTTGRQNRVRRLCLGHDLHTAEVTPSCNFWRCEDRFRTATLALHFERTNRQSRHLFGADLQVLVERLLLNRVPAFRDRFLVTAVRTRQKAVLRFEEEIGAARSTRIMMNFILRLRTQDSVSVINLLCLLCLLCFLWLHSLPRFIPNTRSKKAATAASTLTRFVWRMK